MTLRQICAVLLLTAAAVPAAAQQPSAQAGQTCVGAQVGSQRAYNCVNDSLARLAQQAHSPLATNTLTATSPAPAVGTFNRTATAERMGNAFGHSVIAQRPAPPVFAAPLAGR